MKLITSFSMFFLLWFSGTAQTIEAYSIDSGGATTTSGNLQVFYTLGEVNVQEISVGNIIISEGFINPLQDNGSLSAGQDEFLGSIKVYPNPVSETLTVISNESVEKLEIYSILGKLAFSVENKNEIAVDKLSSGMYLLKISIGNKQATKRIIVK